MNTDSNNPFTPPATELLTPAAANSNLRLYSIAAVGLATFSGTSIAGAYIMAATLKALGREREAKSVWYIGIGIFVAMTLAGFFLPDSVPAMVFTLPPIFAMNAYARQLFGPQVTRHKTQGGAFHSLWQAFGIGLLFSLVIVAVMFLLAMLIMD